MKNRSALTGLIRCISVQIAISAVAIILFQYIYHLKPLVIAGHLLLICCAHTSMLLIVLILNSEWPKIRQKKIRVLTSGMYGLFSIFLYYTYLSAYFGEFYNSKVFTYEIIWGYIKYLDELTDSFLISKTLVYTILFVIPVVIFLVFQLLSETIQRGFDDLSERIAKRRLSHIPKYIFISSVVILGLSFFIARTNSPGIRQKFLEAEEPIASFMTASPFQGQKIASDNQDFMLRKAYPKNINFQKKNVILIVVDALRADHLSLFGYRRKTSPFLDSLYDAGHLTKVKLSFSAASASFAGINGILRSKIWSDIGYSDFSLQQLLKDQGYKLNFLVSGDHTHFYGLKSFYGKNTDFNYYIDGSETKKHIVNDDRIVFEGLQHIEKYNNNPSYFHFHLNSAHYGGIRLDKYKVFLPASVKMDVLNYTNRYDNGVLQADDYIRNIFRTLTEKGYLQNSIVVITADHGEALGERGQFGHVKNVYTDQILVPILIYDTEDVQYKNVDLATSLDIAPTIVDRLKLPIPQSWEGRSLLNSTPRPFTFHQMRDNYAIIHTTGSSRLKYIFNKATKKEELFELMTDLHETKNIIDSVDVKEVNILRKKLAIFRINPS